MNEFLVGTNRTVAVTTKTISAENGGSDSCSIKKTQSLKIAVWDVLDIVLVITVVKPRNTELEQKPITYLIMKLITKLSYPKTTHITGIQNEKRYLWTMGKSLKNTAGEKCF